MTDRRSQRDQEVNNTSVSTYLELHDKEIQDVTFDPTEAPLAKKLLYKVDEVPPPGILLSVALQVNILIPYYF